MTTSNVTRDSTMNLSDDEIKVLAAAVYNGQLSGKLKTFSGLTPSQTAEIATDLFERLNWLLKQADFAQYEQHMQEDY